MRILAFEPYDSGSHHAVRCSISAHSSHEWKWFTRPGHHWKWRLRLAAVELAQQATAALADPGLYDIVFTTSLLHAGDLRSTLPPILRNRPLVLYMHENQAAYPVSAAGREKSRPDWDANYALINLSSMLAADRILWNSQWNMDSFLDGVADILSHAPDTGAPRWLDMIRSRSRVVWPPVEAPDAVLHKPARSRSLGEDGAVRIVWPHRWEHDKGPDQLLAIMRRETRRLNLRWTLLGQQFDRVHPVMQQITQEFAESIDHAGHLASRDAYWDHLCRCDWVLSTARHEFFGLAVAEALIAGCLPWLPERLSYPELLPPVFRSLHPGSPPDNPEAAIKAIRQHLQPAIAHDAVSRLETEIEEIANAT